MALDAGQKRRQSTQESHPFFPGSLKHRKSRHSAGSEEREEIKRLPTDWLIYK